MIQGECCGTCSYSLPAGEARACWALPRHAAGVREPRRVPLLGFCALYQPRVEVQECSGCRHHSDGGDRGWCHFWPRRLSRSGKVLPRREVPGGHMACAFWLGRSGDAR